MNCSIDQAAADQAAADQAAALHRRRQARGAVMLEAVVVVFFLVLIFVAMVSFAGLYRAKMSAMQQARFRNTLNATNSCQIDGPSLSAFAFPTMEGQPSTPADPVQGLHDLARLMVPGVGGGVSRAQATVGFTFGAPPSPTPPPKGTDPPLHLPTKMSAQSVTACNPTIVDLDPVHLVDQVGLLHDMKSFLKSAVTEPLSSMF